MGAAIAAAALEMGHEVVIVSGPVSVVYPKGAEVIDVVSTDDMLNAAVDQFKKCDGVIAVAAPCDYRAEKVADQKIKKTGGSITISLVETEDILASLGRMKTSDQWAVGFALETEDAEVRALKKLKEKRCDLIVLNGAAAINADHSSIRVMDARGDVVLNASGSKTDLGVEILKTVKDKLLLGDS